MQLPHANYITCLFIVNGVGLENAYISTAFGDFKRCLVKLFVIVFMYISLILILCFFLQYIQLYSVIITSFISWFGTRSAALIRVLVWNEELFHLFTRLRRDVMYRLSILNLYVAASWSVFGDTSMLQCLANLLFRLPTIPFNYKLRSEAEIYDYTSKARRFHRQK